MSTSGATMPNVVDVFDTVKQVVISRQKNYGDPDELFGEIAARWSSLDRTIVCKRDVATMMADLKMARLSHAWDEDSAIDAIAYLAFAVMFAGADG